jgi:hypothetical protein
LAAAETNLTGENAVKQDFQKSVTRREANMTELAHLLTRNSAPVQEQRRSKLQDAVSGIPPAEQQQEIAAALEAERERRLELKSKIDELSTEEIERLLSFSASRVGATKIAAFQPQV